MSQVDVWCADPGELEPSGREDSARLLLTSREREHLESFRFERDRRINLATRVLVRKVLSRYEPVHPAEWQFKASAYGRPLIEFPKSQIRFSLSNTSGLVACAVTSSTDVGVDVERLDRSVPLEIAERFFSPLEVAALRDLPPEARPKRFLEYWTLKESYIKARGLGLTLPLDQFWFILQGGKPPLIEIDPILGDSGSSWQFFQSKPTAHHLLSLCIRRRGQSDFHAAEHWQSLA